MQPPLRLRLVKSPLLGLAPRGSRGPRKVHPPCIVPFAYSTQAIPSLSRSAGGKWIVGGPVYGFPGESFEPSHQTILVGF